MSPRVASSAERAPAPQQVLVHGRADEPEASLDHSRGALGRGRVHAGNDAVPARGGDDGVQGLEQRRVVEVGEAREPEAQAEVGRPDVEAVEARASTRSRRRFRRPSAVSIIARTTVDSLARRTCSAPEPSAPLTGPKLRTPLGGYRHQPTSASASAREPTIGQTIPRAPTSSARMISAGSFHRVRTSGDSPGHLDRREDLGGPVEGCRAVLEVERDRVEARRRDRRGRRVSFEREPGVERRFVASPRLAELFRRHGGIVAARAPAGSGVAASPRLLEDRFGLATEPAGVALPVDHAPVSRGAHAGVPAEGRDEVGERVEAGPVADLRDAER